MKLSQLMGALPYGVHDVDITDVTNDSRAVKPGMAFVCLKGGSTDGHRFAVAAAEKGAAAVIAEHNVGVDCQVIVPDTHVVYAKMCSALYGDPKDRLKLIGVTGTNGKTTTTYLLKSVLEQLGKKVGLIGTIHNMIGERVIPTENTTPDAHQLHSLFREMADAGCEYVVMEVSSHALDQERVCGLHFAAAIFTNLTQDHLDYHGTMENYLAAKKKLFLRTDLAIVNADDAASQAITEGLTCPVATYGIERPATYQAKGIRYLPDGVVFELLGGTDIARVTLKTPGRFSVYNGLAAASCLLSLGFGYEQTAACLSNAAGVPGRAEVVPLGRDFTVILDYAHTPDGLENILKTVNEIKRGRLVILFGCGGDRDATKRPIMGKIAADLADFCIVTSDNPRTEEPEAIIRDILEGMKGTSTPKKVIVNRRDAIRFALENAEPDDMIVLAGKGHEDYQIIGTTKHPFDERVVIREILEETSGKDDRR
ncbi:MAG: UDP-N-acetylmuramoyl-L-alanyl-D-glutamate--2,6-diaminopimelate ligase [Clostridia bacterium]|nr:UDP-N-acetylmuramoyl-L-alanyl-D-glutamate--2,6-diaminopimelate ligase [Clostridia bacterium]